MAELDPWWQPGEDCRYERSDTQPPAEQMQRELRGRETEEEMYSRAQTALGEIMRHSEGQACECRLLYEVWIQGREEKVQALISRRQHHEPLVLPQRAVQGPGQSESGTEGRRDLSLGGPGGDKGVKGMELLLPRCMYDLEIRVLGVLTRARARQSAEPEHRSQCLTDSRFRQAAAVGTV